MSDGYAGSDGHIPVSSTADLGSTPNPQPTDDTTTRNLRTFEDNPMPPASRLPTQADRDAEMRETEREHRDNYARKLAERGIAPPSPTTKLFVTTGRGIPNRRRAGIQFNGKSRVEVSVKPDLTDEEAKARTDHGEAVVNAWGYCEIMGDDGLVVHATATDVVSVAVMNDLQTSNDRLAAENEELRRALLDQARTRDAAPAAKLPDGPPTAKAEVMTPTPAAPKSSK
jgi:hypothetical protein